MSSIKTYTGVMFDPVHPESERIDILDIVHFRSFYSGGASIVSIAPGGEGERIFGAGAAGVFAARCDLQTIS